MEGMTQGQDWHCGSGAKTRRGEGVRKPDWHLHPISPPSLTTSWPTPRQPRAFQEGTRHPTNPPARPPAPKCYVITTSIPDTTTISSSQQLLLRKLYYN
ncbi:hypothetical protein Pcinc_031561 [Petrolisthes cinctipes]|uniref:Uncharacterized protein n=1 Tax=Petrolisthes cinctipes TaxID=88211 RepID=A0AAE1EVU3_PETCI|nr:hypothetical protein Pcinc_031561 [Petrolisthes cinctipes]